MAAVIKTFAVGFVVVVALSGTWVSAETHHVVGDESGWGPALNVTSWLLGRVFRVGDKIWFKYAEAEDSIVELQGLEEFLSCNLTNPIRMYTDRGSHIALEEEGVRYFTSGNLENCKNGLKLPVPVQPHTDFDSPSSPEDKPLPPFHPSPRDPDHSPPHDPDHSPPHEPDHPPPHDPDHSPPHDPDHSPPHEPDHPPPHEPYHPPPHEPVEPPPEPRPRPPPPRPPSAAVDLKALSFASFAGLLICYMGI